MTASVSEETIRDHDILALLEAGVSMIALEDLYGPKAVHRVAETYITSALPTDDDDDDADGKHHDRRSKLATLLFLRAPSSSAKAIMKSHDVIDAVFEALVADPDDPLLMDPLLHTPLHDPVVLSSGIVVDRSTAIDPATGNLRLTKCPFRRIPLTSPVYEIYPLQDKIREWEHARLERCVSVAQTFMKEAEYDRAERVFTIANDFLQEHQQHFDSQNRRMAIHNSQNKLTTTTPGGSHYNDERALSTSGTNVSQKHHTREILLLALQLAQLEREIPEVKDDISRTVGIHKRLILVARACSTDKQDRETLVIACLEDCWKRCSMLLAFGGKDASKKALGIRHAFAPLIKYTTLMELNLTEALQKLCHLDLRLAKHVEDEPSIWNCRRVLLKLLPEAEQAAFLESEGITGTEEDLYYHLLYDASLWPQEKFVDPAMGLVHFGTSSTTATSRSQDDNSGPTRMTQTRGLACTVNLNPHAKGDHWIEVAFRPDNIQSPGYQNTILSQHAEGTGWEIRCAVIARSHFLFGGGNPFAGENEKREPGIYVESVWTTTDGGDNAFTNSKVPLEIGTWYHVVLAYCHETSTISLYVNGIPARREVQGNFVPARGLPRLGENIHWTDRRFQGWVAFGGGGYELPVHGKDTAALDDHVQKLAKARLAKLPSQPALHEPNSAVVDDEDGSEEVEDGSGRGEDSSLVESVTSSGQEDDDPEDSDSDSD